ncbi:MAG: CoA ester lyase [Alphaproteobacteria bacterium]|nr:MAG: CoA ester lyase [Alphaproteobacteria bacterium]
MNERVAGVRPRRSVLYMPGSNARALEKARTLAADALILDLEDSVAPEAKEDARAQVCAAVAAGGYGRREVVVRVNGLGTPWGEGDLSAVAASGADAVCIPKVESGTDFMRAREVLAAADAPARLAIWAMIETPRAILALEEIARAADSPANPATVLVMGTNDLAKETRAQLTADRLPMLAWLSRSVIAARAYGLDILDGVYNNFRDEEGLRREALQGRQLGMDGKTLIHPGQIAVANEVFSPSQEEVAWARAIIAAFEQPENAGKGVITVDGNMVELLHRDIALRTVAIAEATAGE